MISVAKSSTVTAVPASRRAQADVLHTEFIAQLGDPAGHRLGTANECATFPFTPLG